jgi:AcrR family transcriptional regulator
MLDLSTPKGRVIAGALRLAGERRWRDVTLADIAAAANIRLVDLRREFDTKGDILAAFVRAVDDAVLARTPERSASGTTSPRDAIFEVVMSRFDVLAPYRPALKSIAESWPADPAHLRALAASPAWMLRAARIEPEGFDGKVRTAGLGAVYAAVFRTWLDDDDPGLARTMAALDRRLRRGERTLQSLDDVKTRLCNVACAFTRPAKRAAPEPGPASAPESPPAAPV